MDCVRPIGTPSGEYRYWLALIDSFSKHLTLAPLKTISAKEIAYTFVTKYVAIYGSPDVILTDRAPSFIGKMMTEICNLLGTKMTKTMGNAPKSNESERSHRTVYSILACTLRKVDKWGAYLPFAKATHNFSKHASHGYTPQDGISWKTPVC